VPKRGNPKEPPFTQKTPPIPVSSLGLKMRKSNLLGEEIGQEKKIDSYPSQSPELSSFTDGEKVFIDRSDGIDATIIPDGHISRMMGPFLEYLNNPQHRWSAMLGIPCDTHLWQAGDSAEQNGALKIAMTKWKRWLRQQNADFGFQQTIEKTDIMLLLTLSWAESFTIVENNNNACADRGWNTLNYALMEHEDLQEGAMT
jgi:hypothetical protein